VRIELTTSALPIRCGAIWRFGLFTAVHTKILYFQLSRLIPGPVSVSFCAKEFPL
jgi:hypothetical protein